jgi:hypothetical protein
MLDKKRRNSISICKMQIAEDRVKEMVVRIAEVGSAKGINSLRLLSLIM